MNLTEEELKLLEYIPIGAAFCGQQIALAKDVQPEWCITPEVQQMYAELRNYAKPLDLYMVHSRDPIYLRAVQEAAGKSEEFVQNAIKELKRHYYTARQNELIGKFIVAEDDQERLIIVNQLRQMLGHSDSGLQKVDLSQPCPPLECLLTQDGVGFIAKKAICAIKAKAKNGKSHLCAVLAAALTGRGECLGIERNGNPHRVLYVDTEQEMPSTEYIAKHVHRLNGWDMHSNNDLLQVVNVRRVKTSERLGQVEALVQSGRFEVLIVDGIKDLVHDINDTIEATKIMDELMRLIELNNVAFVTVIHENKGESKEMRGHLGTELLNKCYEVFEVAKDKENDLFKVTCTDRRGRDLPDWAFTFNEQDELIRVDLPAEPVKKSRREQKEEQIANIVRHMYEEQPQVSQTYSELYGGIMRFSDVSERTAKVYIRTALDNGIIEQMQDGRYSLIRESPYISPNMMQALTSAPF